MKLTPPQLRDIERISKVAPALLRSVSLRVLEGIPQSASIALDDDSIIIRDGERVIRRIHHAPHPKEGVA